MSAPKKYPENRIQSQIRFKRDVHAALTAMAHERRVSFTYLVEKACEALLAGQTVARTRKIPAPRQEVTITIRATPGVLLSVEE